LQRKLTLNQELYPLPMSDRRKAEAIAEARREIARRIARFCTSLSPQEFERLVDRMAHIQWKYDVLPHLDFLIEEEGATDEYPRPS
jgi:hypothetical protein